MGKQSNNERAVFRVELSPEAVASITELRSRIGITQIAMMSRLMTWLEQQPPAIRAAVLGLHPTVFKQDVTQVVLEKLAADNAEPKPPKIKN